MRVGAVWLTLAALVNTYRVGCACGPLTLSFDGGSPTDSGIMLGDAGVQTPDGGSTSADAGMLDTDAAVATDGGPGAADSGTVD